MEYNQDVKEQIEQWKKAYSAAEPDKLMAFFARQFPGRTVLSSSLGSEDQVLTDMIIRLGLPVSIFTLDTGRLFPETYQLLEKNYNHYGVDIAVYFPDALQVEEMVRSKGINLFYQSIENRKHCCQIRKIEPLKRALAGNEVWVTGIRKEQTLNRFYNEMVEWDDSNQLIKISPLLNWNEKKVWEYIHKHNVPYNSLHDRGFPSIGCQPCTRAVQDGDDPRSGRWWWEDQGNQECGLHLKE
jgi:phosphoadenosine phosphosulfate reductase